MIIRSFICVSILLIGMPYISYATDTSSTIGNNLGLDFYSRIDDAGGALAQAITSRRILEKGNYGSLGCGAPWLTSERIIQGDLEALRAGNTAILPQLAIRKHVSLTTDSENSLRQCLVEKYNKIVANAYEDQDTLETVGNVGLYLDGDTANSDYDIIADITRINAIIFKEKYPYTGTKNATAKSIANLIHGGAIAPLFPIDALSGSLASGNASGSAIVPPSEASGSSTLSGTSDGALPWAGVCRVSTGSDDHTSLAGLFPDDFLSDISSVLAGGRDTSPGRLAYSSLGTDILDTSSGSNSPFGISEKSDFYHAPSCDGLFCITVDMIGGNQSLLGGYTNISIESLLEQHTKMMDPISWSDLSAQKMTNNSYQLPFLNIKIADKLAGLKVYTTESPQIKKKLKTEDTAIARDAVFDAAFRCAMNEAGLPGDPILANGFIGAGYTGLRSTTTVANRTTILGPKEMDDLKGCYQIRMGNGQKEAYKSLSTDLNEIQAFTQSMMQIIKQILETDHKLDALPTK